MTRPNDAVDVAFPLLITHIEIHDVVVTLAGPSWALSLVCPWDFTAAWVTDFDWESTDFAVTLAPLIGEQLTGMRAERDLLVDPVFEFGRAEISIHADSDLDPWVFRADGVVMVGCSSTPAHGDRS